MRSWIIFSIIFLSFFACKQESENTQASKIDLAIEEPVHISSNGFLLKEGDLLFQDGDCGSFCEAIEKVTHGKNGARLSHVGMVIQGASSEYAVLEAISKGVVETPIDSFLQRSKDAEGHPKVLVGRLKTEQQKLIRPAIQYALTKRGKAYDSVFDINNDQYYCSELLYFAFKKANEGTPIFQLRPMTYKDPQTKETFPIWLDYFKELGKFIPEGQPGLNPGSMSRSIYLDIIHAYGKPEGYQASTLQ